MFTDIKLDKPLTLGKLKELINTDKLGKLPDDTKIYMVLDLYNKNIEDFDYVNTPIESILGDENSINFYNYK